MPCRSCGKAHAKSREYSPRHCAADLAGVFQADWRWCGPASGWGVQRPAAPFWYLCKPTAQGLRMKWPKFVPIAAGLVIAEPETGCEIVRMAFSPNWHSHCMGRTRPTANSAEGGPADQRRSLPRAHRCVRQCGSTTPMNEQAKAAGTTSPRRFFFAPRKRDWLGPGATYEHFHS